VAQAFGNPTGPTYCFGRINVAVPGTPAPLNQNVSNNTAFGTAANPATMRCNEITFKAPGGTGGAGGNAANVGNVYVCFKGGNRTIQNSVIVDLQPGQGFVLSNAGLTSPFDPTQFVIDSDSPNDGCRVSAIIV
jgi:hypothetical protein